MAYLLNYCTHSKPHISYILTTSNNPKEKSVLSYLHSRCDCIQKPKSSGVFLTLYPSLLLNYNSWCSSYCFVLFWGGGDLRPKNRILDKHWHL